MTTLGSSLRIGVRISVALTVVSAVAWGSAAVFPNRSTPGAYERYSLRITNEREVPTVRVEIHFPPDLRVVSFGDVPGWSLQILTDSSERITGAVWTGVLSRQRFIEFPFVALNPKDSTSLAWPTTQSYQGGEVVQWTNPDTASNTRVPSTLVANTSAPPLRVSRRSLYISLGALLVALTALGVALRPRGVEVNP
jgi:uncharacterized protein YcnI